MNISQIIKEISEMENSLSKLDNLINTKNQITKNNIDLINNLNKKLLLIKINLDKSKLHNQSKDIKDIEIRIKFIDHNMRLLNQYINMTADYHSSKSLDKLTILNTIFLPLGLICSYFGMNFASMGCPTKKGGILNIKNSNFFIFILFLISIFVTIIILLI